jgi:1-acyl-sn-glycerol-3-phosphate acyltransferase
MNTGLYDASAAMLRAMFSTVFRARVRGTENVPASGPLIVACNHLSYLDPPALCYCPRRIQFMAKRELFEIPLLAPLIRALGAYPVDRHGSPQAAIKQSLSALKEGGAIGIFPEGTRNLDGAADAQLGMALLAAWSSATVVPTCILGGDHVRKLGRFQIAFGTPMVLASGRKATRDELAKFTGEVMDAIGSLAESFRGDS